MPEPISLSILLLLKALGGKALAAKLALIVKGMLFTAHGQSALMLAKCALIAIKSYGIAQGAAMVAQMLIILGSVAATATAAVHARECLRRAGASDFTGAVRHGRRALREAGPVLSVWSPA